MKCLLLVQGQVGTCFATPEQMICNKTEFDVWIVFQNVYSKRENVSEDEMSLWTTHPLPLIPCTYPFQLSSPPLQLEMPSTDNSLDFQQFCQSHHIIQRDCQLWEKTSFGGSAFE